MDFHRPLIPAAAGLMGGIVLGACLPGYFVLASAATAVLAGALLVCILRRRTAGMMPLLFLAATGYLSVQPWLVPHLPGHHVSRFADRGKWLIQGVVADEPVCRRGRLRFVLNARHLTGKTGSFQVCGALQATAALPGPVLHHGDRVSFSGHVRKVRNFSNPGGFDYERYMALRGILVRAYADKSGLKLMAGNTLPSGSGFFNSLRRSLSMGMDRALAGSSPDTRQLLKALTLGERRTLPEGLRETFARVGVGHLLAISGLHIGIVALCAYGAAMRLLVFWPWLLARGWVRKAASLTALTAVCIYGVLAGLSPSTQRAMIMVAVFLAGWWVGRSHDWFNTLAVAAIILLILTPHALLNVSFQLSFAAVATILIGLNRSRSRSAPEWSQGLRRALQARLGTFAWVTLLATLGTLPLIMRYFNQISLVGPLANLFAVPLAGSLAVPCGLSGCLLAGVSPALAGWLWQAAALALDGVLLVVQWASRWDYAAVTCVTPTWLEIALFYGLLWLALTPGRHRIKIVALGLILSAGAADAAYWIHKRYDSSRLCVTALDVGQGAAHLLQLPGGFTALVDGGGFGDPRIFDVGERIVAPLLWRNKIRTVDLVVLSHPNADHLNGLLFILRHFNIGEVWSNHQPADTLGYKRWSSIIRSRGIVHRPFEQLPRHSTRGGVDFEILNPRPGFMARSREENWRDLNENSLVLKVSLGAISFLFCGDIGWRTEVELVRLVEPGRLKSTVLFVPHHGSAGSSSTAFLKAVQPGEAVVSAGWQNIFHFPHARTLKRLEAAAAHTWRTDLCGAVRIVSTGTDYFVATCRPCRSSGR